MILDWSKVKVFVKPGPTDMRKQIDICCRVRPRCSTYRRLINFYYLINVLFTNNFLMLSHGIIGFPNFIMQSLEKNIMDKRALASTRNTGNTCQ